MNESLEDVFVGGANGSLKAVKGKTEREVGGVIEDAVVLSEARAVDAGVMWSYGSWLG
jgi:hypothetical protein